jgi:predicted nucleic acid-binding protein
VKIAYVDSSIVVRYYLPNDPGRGEVVGLLNDNDVAVVTSALTRIESSGALVRAARSTKADATDALARLDYDFADGVITLVGADHAEVEDKALHAVRTYGIRALDALHIATAQVVLPELIGPGDTAVFISRDKEQADAARNLGLTVE